MNLVDGDRAAALYAAMGPAVETRAGPRGNTAAGVASFGGRAAFIGKVRDDQLGTVYRHDIRAIGVQFDVPPATSGPATAQSFILVHPDAQRTMNTYLGVAGELTVDDVDEELVARAAITYCEGYLWDVEGARDAMRLAIATAGAGRRLVVVHAVGQLLRRPPPRRVPRARVGRRRHPLRQRGRGPDRSTRSTTSTTPSPACSGAAASTRT